MSPSRIIFVNRFYWPDEPATAQLLTDLAEALAARGQSVIVITSGDSSAAADEVHAGVAIRRVRQRRFAGSGPLAKARAWLGFALGASWELNRILQPGDRLVLLTDPPLLALLAGPIARRRRARIFHWVQDVYPELPERIMGLRGMGLIRFGRNREWRLADGVVVLGTDMDHLVRACGVAKARVQAIANWAPRGLAPAAPKAIARQRRDWELQDKCVLAYSGNFGRVHALEPILDLAEALRDEPAFVFLFIGRGAQQARLQDQVMRRRLDNVRFEPPQPREDLAVTLGVGDIHFVTLHEACADLVFPSKYYGILAVGRPLLFIGPANCELAQTIAHNRLGGVFAPSDVTAMASLLRTWQRNPNLIAAMGQNALSFHRILAGSDSAADRWISLLNPPAANQIPQVPSLPPP